MMLIHGDALKPARYVLTLLGLTVIAFWAFGRAEPDKARERTVAFDNVYGNVKRLQVYVVVDGSAEQASSAKCDERTCTFKLRLTNARHELLMSVEQDGKRSAPTRVTIDTSRMR